MPGIVSEEVSKILYNTTMLGVICTVFDWGIFLESSSTEYVGVFESCRAEPFNPTL